MIDLERVRAEADLLALALGDTPLVRVASSGGGEWAGPCPICRAGEDRFRVQPHGPNGPRWLCRKCTGGKWRSVIDYIAMRDGLDPRKAEDLAEICRRALGGHDLPSTSGPRVSPQPEARPAASAPALDWQDAAKQVIAECQATLWDPKYAKVLDYLRARGLRDATIRAFSLGYCATGEKSAYGRKIAGLYIPRGVLIPGLARGRVWYLKIRLLPGVPCRCQKCKSPMDGAGVCPHCGESNKYRGVKGNKTASIFAADLLGRGVRPVCLFVEGEFDAMLAWQELGDLLPTATLGSATNRPDLATWGRYFINKSAVLLAYDRDEAGQRGAQALGELSSYAVAAPLPEGQWKDLTDFYLAGGDLRQWLEPIVERYDPLNIEGDTPMLAQALRWGAVVREG